ncbi:hypothetical protein C8Q80DRAFT_1177215, partial [Daedaleopsis nitida]
MLVISRGFAWALQVVSLVVAGFDSWCSIVIHSESAIRTLQVYSYPIFMAAFYSSYTSDTPCMSNDLVHTEVSIS